MLERFQRASIKMEMEFQQGISKDSEMKYGIILLTEKIAGGQVMTKIDTRKIVKVNA